MSEVARGQTWQNNRHGFTVEVNDVLDEDVQVLTSDRTALRWITIRGLRRDYTKVN